MSDVLMEVGGDPVYIAQQEHLWWVGELTVDGDGSPRCYGPKGCKPDPLDYLENAGHPGNWWGIATGNGQSDGNPVVQGKGDPYPGLYVSTTAYINKGFEHSDPRCYVDSETVPFIVIPSNVRKACEGICKGCLAVMIDRQQDMRLRCVVADIGPSDHLGEASIAAAKYFGINPDPKKGGSSDKNRWEYHCFPGLACPGFELQS